MKLQDWRPKFLGLGVPSERRAYQAASRRERGEFVLPDGFILLFLSLDTPFCNVHSCAYIPSFWIASLCPRSQCWSQQYVDNTICPEKRMSCISVDIPLFFNYILHFYKLFHLIGKLWNTLWTPCLVVINGMWKRTLQRRWCVKRCLSKCTKVLQYVCIHVCSEGCHPEVPFHCARWVWHFILHFSWCVLMM